MCHSQADSDDDGEPEGPPAMTLTAMRNDDDAVPEKRGMGGADRRASIGADSLGSNAAPGMGGAILGWMSRAMSFGGGGGGGVSAPRAGRGKR